MSPFDEVVGGMRVSSSLYAHFRLRAPWGVHFHTADEARLLIVSRGSCWLVEEGGVSPVFLAPGTCMILKAGVSFALMDAPGRDSVLCETLITAHDGSIIDHGGGGELTELVSGRFSFDPVAAEPLVSLMPPLSHAQMEAGQAELLQMTLRLMGLETAKEDVGAGLVIDRLGDALFIQALRAFCFAHGACTGSWLAGMTDSHLRRAIRAVHSNLANVWTVEDMAREAGLSRSSFAARFKRVVGEAPLDYLTGWRMYRAKLLLSGSDENLASIASHVGYESEVSLSRTFRRRFGVPPGQWRRAARQTAVDRQARHFQPHAHARATASVAAE